jgi:hypothetical protein
MADAGHNACEVVPCGIAEAGQTLSGTREIPLRSGDALTVADGLYNINVNVTKSSMVSVLQALTREALWDQVIAELMQNVVDWLKGLFWLNHPHLHSKKGFSAYLDPAGLFPSSITVTIDVGNRRITGRNKATMDVLFEALITADSIICIIQMGIGQLDINTLNMTGSHKNNSPAEYGGAHGQGGKQIIAFVAQDGASWMQVRGTIDAAATESWRASAWDACKIKDTAHVNGSQLENGQDVVPPEMQKCMSEAARATLERKPHLCHILSFADGDASSAASFFDALCRSTLVFRADSATVRLVHPSHPATALILPDRLGRCTFVNAVPTIHGPDFGWSVIVTGAVKALTNPDRGKNLDTNFCPIQQQVCNMIEDFYHDLDPHTTELLVDYLKEHHRAFQHATAPVRNDIIHGMKRCVAQCPDAQHYISSIKSCCFEFDCDHTALFMYGLEVLQCPQVPPWFRWAVLEGTGDQNPPIDAEQPLPPIATEIAQSCSNRIYKHLANSSQGLIPLSEHEANRQVITRLKRLRSVLVSLGTRMGCRPLTQTTIALLDIPTGRYGRACTRADSTVRVSIDHIEDEDLMASVAQCALTEIAECTHVVANAVRQLWVNQFDLDALQSTDPEQTWRDYGASLCVLCGYAVPGELSTSSGTVAWTSACWQREVSLHLVLS